MVTRLRMVGVGILLLFVIAVIYLWQRHRVYQVFEHALASSDTSVSDVREYMGAFMRVYGSSTTYEKMKVALRGAPSTSQHTMAHIFGELLYKKEGLGGIVICDASFGFGCYHSFFGSAIAKTGEEKVSELDAACVAQYGVMGLGCPHGIGHGLGEYFGPNKIDQQLRVCEGLAWKGKYFGCQSGVFMEYNTPVMTQGEQSATTVRPFDPTRPYGVCLDVDVRFQPACFLELGAWWEQVLMRDYSHMGALCSGLVSGENKESCFVGIGYAVAQSTNYNFSETIQACEQMSSSQFILLCRAGASWSFFANPQYRVQASGLCEIGNEDDRAVCREKSDLLSY